MKFLFFVLVGVGFAFLCPTHALAGETGLTVTPVFQEVTLATDEAEARFSITLTNQTDGPLVLRPSVVDFGSLDESGGVAFLGASDNLVRKYSLASWMRPEKDIVSLEAGESEDLRVVIENRESLSPGGHYGAVLFTIGNEEGDAKENVVAVNQLLSVLVFAKKEGGEIYRLNLLDRTWERSLLFGLSQTSLRFQNEGNVHIVPRGIVTLTDPLGRVVEKGIINTESSLVLPESQRTFVTKLSLVTPLLIPGRYTLTTDYRYDGQEAFESAVDTITLLPWPTFVAILVLGIGFFGLRLRKK